MVRFRPRRLRIFFDDVDKNVKERPDVVRRFTRAFHRAVLFNLDHPAEAAKHLHAMVPDVDVEAAAGDVRATLPLIKNEISEKYGIGNFDPARFKRRGNGWQKREATRSTS